MHDSGKVPVNRGLRIFRPSDQKSDTVFRFSLAILPFLSELEGIDQSEKGGRAQSADFNLLSSFVKLSVLLCFLFSSGNFLKAEDLAFVLTETHTDVACFGSNDGTIDLTIAGAVPPYTVDWDHNGIGDLNDPEDLSGLSPGDYTVVVVDASLDVQSIIVTIAEPAFLSLTHTQNELSCAGADDGSIDLTIFGGTAPYTIDWDDDGTGDFDDTQDLTNLALGTYNVVVKDAIGCIATSSVVLTVNDNVAPVPDVTTLSSVNAECSVSVSAPTATDNCAGSITASTSSPTLYSSQGTYTITWVYDDGNGNTVTQDQTVVIDDVSGPVPSVASLPDITEECNATLAAPTAIDNCVGLLTATTTAPTNYSSQGSYALFWVFDDGNGNIVVQAQNVIVDDVTAPIPDVPILPDIIAECDATLSAPTATDNCEGSIVASTADPVYYDVQGTYSITWTYDDGNGNTSIQSQTVIIDDVTSPIPNVAMLADVTAECTATVSAPSAMDNCEGSIVATSTDLLSFSDQGTYSITWNYDDGNGNTAIQTQTVIIDDITLPIAVCQPVTIDLGGGVVVLDSTLIDGGSSDNCNGWTISANPNTFSAIGDYPVTLTISDVGGNTDDCTATVTVEDTTPPLCLAIDTTLYLDASGMVSINSLDLDGGSLDNGMIVNYLASDTVFSCADLNFPSASNNITLIVTDESGNSSSCISQVTVLDTIAPTVFCQNIIVELDSNGLYTLDPSLLDFGSSDICGIDTMYTDVVTFDCDDANTIVSVVLTVEDQSGNTSSCSSMVFVEDNILPEMTCTPAITVNNDPGLCGAFVNYTIPGVIDNCSTTITAQPGSGHNPGDFFPVGTTWVGYYASNPSNGATVTCWFPITVYDTEEPEIYCPPNDTVSANSDCQAILGDYTSSLTASDNCTAGGSLFVVQSPPSGIIISGNTTVNFRVTDARGNSTFCSFVVVVEDNSDPQIDPMTCPADQTVYLDMDCEYTIGDYTGVISVSDNCVPTASLSIVQDPIAGTVMSGHGTSQLVSLTVTDANGNSSVCDFTLTASDTIAPVIDAMTCPGDQTVTLNDTCYFLIPDYRTGLTIADNCESPVDLLMTQVPAPGTPLSGDGTVQLVVVSVDDLNGNISTCEFTLTLDDATQPVFVNCAENDTVSADADCEHIIGDYTGEVTVTDNCGDPSTITLSQIPLPGSAISGATTVIITAEDQNGLLNTCSFVVVVEDDTDPEIDVLTCPGDQMVYLDTSCDYVIGDYTGTITVSDNCTPSAALNIIQDPPTGTVISGHNTSQLVSLNVTDANGNSALCAFTLTALDTIAPEISCPGDITQNVDMGMPSAVVNYMMPVATDNCSGATLSQIDATGLTTGSAFPVGITTLIYQVTDMAGLTDTCSFEITVIDNAGPLVICPDTFEVDAPIGFCDSEIPLIIPIPIATDNDSVASLINDYTGTGDASAIYPVGVTVITWTATDISGNIGVCEQVVVVNDVEAPSGLVCPNDTSYIATIGECGIDSTLVELTWPTAFDPCDTLVITNDAPSSFLVGTTTVTWTIADLAGNSLTCVQSITVTDDEPPTLDPASCPPAQTVTVDDGECGTASVNVTLTGPTASDPCGIFDVYHNAPDTFELGSTIVTWYIEDNNGNIDSTCTQEITVVDDENPIIVNCPDMVGANATLGECGVDSALVVLGTTIATDPCGISSIVNDAPAYYTVGTTAVTWTVTDSNGNTSTCIQNVIVADIEEPSNLVCPLDTTISATIGECGIDSALVDLIWPTAYDPCDTLVITNDAPSSYPVGSTTVTWTIADTSGNAIYCSQDVIIVDDQDPVPTICPVDTVIVNDLDECGAIFNYPLPEATDNCGVAEINKTEGLDSGEMFPVGQNYVEYEIVDSNGNITICGFTVTVLDTQLPTFNDPIIIEYEQVEGECESTVIFNIPVGEDNCPNPITTQVDGTGLTSGDIFPVGTTILTYQVVDASGNVTELDVQFDVEDTEPPIVMSCPENMVLPADIGLCGATSSLIPPIAIDNCGSVTMIHNAPAIFPIGTTPVTWTISDQAGNTEYCLINVIVTDDEAPTVTCPSDVIVEAPWGDCETNVFIESIIASDNCAIGDILNDFNFTDDASGSYSLGSTLVNWTVIDINGNAANCQMTVTVNTSGAPEILCNDDIIVESEAGLCEAFVLLPQPTMEYECGIVEVANDFNGGIDADGNYPVGNTVVTWTVEDISGNFSQCSTSVTVIDSQVPSISCQDDISIPNDIGICGAFVNYELPTIWDNCGIAELLLMEGQEPGGLFNDGTTQITYQVNDVNGNSATCSFEVTITDVETPIIVCPEDMIVVDSMVNYLYPEYSDNCYAELILISGPDSGDEFDHGYTDVLFAAVDLYGNMDTCEFQVLVNTPPVAVNDTVIIFESDDEITVDMLQNDYDLDGDSISVTEILFGSQLGYTDGNLLYYNIPDSDCGIDSVGYVLQDEFGATDTAVVFVEVECYPSIFVPDGFSPNGDGVNDVLHILGLHEYPDNNLKVFNRWGHKVCDRSDYQNDWDGRSEAALTIGDTYLPRGTYFYILDIGEDNIKPLKGFFYINPR